jgi:hypothetical protein
MIATILLIAFLQPQAAGLDPTPPHETITEAPRVEKLTPAQFQQMNDAKQAVADAQAKLDRAKAAAQSTTESKDAKQAVDDAQDKLIHAKAALRGATEGIEQDHHANTDCGCYVASTGREYDKVEFKDDTIIIHHIKELPASLSKVTP